MYISCCHSHKLLSDYYLNLFRFFAPTAVLGRLSEHYFSNSYKPPYFQHKFTCAWFWSIHLPTKSIHEQEECLSPWRLFHWYISREESYFVSVPTSLIRASPSLHLIWLDFILLETAPSAWGPGPSSTWCNAFVSGSLESQLPHR